MATKAEFLTALGATDFIEWVGTPELLETKPEDATKWYAVNCREVMGGTAVYRNVHFYVVDEGGAGEAAYHKDDQLIQTTKQRELYDWMLLVVDGATNNYKAIQVHWVSERFEMVVYSILIDDASDVKWQTYYVRKGHGTAQAITNHESWRLSSQFNV
jgi:hypothetical protein